MTKISMLSFQVPARNPILTITVSADVEAPDGTRQSAVTLIP